MTRMRRVTVLLLAVVVSALFAVGCGGSVPVRPGIPVNAAASFVVWKPAETTSGTSMRGTAVDIIDVRGGELVQLHTDRPVQMAERLRSGNEFAETWWQASPQGGTILLRATLFATALLVPRGAIDRAYIGHSSDPGYLWLDLEDRVLEWAEGPLTTPFPLVAAKERLDVAFFDALGKALDDEVRRARDPKSALEAARAIRRVAGLRAVRTLRPAAGYPYFIDRLPEPGAKQLEEDGKTVFEIAPNAPANVSVEGPGILHVWSKAARKVVDETIDLSIFEGTRLRGESGATIARTKMTGFDQDGMHSSELVPLRRALIHVPPGTHTYRMVTQGEPAYVFPMMARPLIHLGDGFSGRKNEQPQLEAARAACGSAPGICAIALALGGEDAGDAWTKALDAAPPPARGIATDVSRGAPHDPMLELELAASQGDGAALGKLDTIAQSSIDEGVRHAWARAVSRGTRWGSAESEHGAGVWPALFFETSDIPVCAKHADVDWPEINDQEAEFATTLWHGVQALELVSSSSCNEKGPVELMIDGERVTAQPSAGLVEWHVRVTGATSAKVKRLDKNGGHVYAIRKELSVCGARWEAMRSPHLASSAPKLTFDPAGEAPGLDVWLRQGASTGEINVAPLKPGPGVPDRMSVVVDARAAKAHEKGGLAALDEGGVRWVRVARVPLPAWAAGGVQVSGGNDVAVRALVRGQRPPEEPVVADETHEPEPLDEKRLVKLSQEMLAVPPDLRGKFYMERAELLARGGVSRGALEDARAAQALGVRGPKGEEPTILIRSQIRLHHATAAAFPPGTKTFGAEPDFDPQARRCSVDPTSPRAQLASVSAELLGRSRSRERKYDPVLATKVLAAVRQEPLDPRGNILQSRALLGSRWRAVRQVGPLQRVKRPRTVRHDGPVDSDGELRARVIAGQPFEEGTYAALTTRPAKAILTRAGDAKARLEVVCVSRDPAEARGPCPIEVIVGNGPIQQVPVGPDGRGFIELKISDPTTPVAMGIRRGPGRWAAISRIVFDKEVPGAVAVPGSGYVLEPPHVDYRFLLKSGETATQQLTGPGLVRMDALEEPGSRGRVTVTYDGKEETLATDGSEVVFPLPNGGPISVRATGGPVTIAYAERIPNVADPPPDDAPDDAADDAKDDKAPADAASANVSGLVMLDLSGARAAGSWRDTAEHSPRPLTPLEAALGTFQFGTGAVAGTMREGSDSTDPDRYGFAFVGYRRRIESINLWTAVTGNFRVRDDGQHSQGSSLILYEDLDELHLRVTGTLTLDNQTIDGTSVNTFGPRGFIEYSWRPARTFFILPRLGFDGFYTTYDKTPKSLSNVDDAVYNSFRVKRTSLAFLQSLFWFTPFFNDIFYLRTRSTFDVNNKDLSHVAVRPGMFLVFDTFDISAFVDNAFFRPTPGVPTSQSHVDVLAGANVTKTFWYGIGSFALQPGLAGSLRANDVAWQASAFLNVFASYRRGLRDFSSLELDFPEQLSGGIPWRGAVPGGYQ